MLSFNFNDTPPKGKKLKFTFTHSSYGGSNNNTICYYNGYLVYQNTEHYPIITPDSPSPKVYILSKKLKKELETFIKTSKWKRRYDNNDMLDGTQWTLKVFDNGKIRESYGSNEWPNNYLKLKDFIFELMPFDE